VSSSRCWRALATDRDPLRGGRREAIGRIDQAFAVG